MALVLDAIAVQHQGDRAEQQDRLALVPHPRRQNVVLAIVADGMGGHAGGALAAEQVVLTARNALEGLAPQDDRQLFLRELLLEAHQMIRVGRCLNEKDPHSTAVLLLLEPGLATWAYCGDSRLYHFPKGRPIFHTVDHSYVEQLLAQGKISEEEALHHPHRNILITALGGERPPRIDTGQSASIEHNDAFLLCSDGLWTYFSDGELAALSHWGEIRRSSELMVERARQRAEGQGDNLSLILLRYHAEPES